MSCQEQCNLELLPEFFNQFHNCILALKGCLEEGQCGASHAGAQAHSLGQIYAAPDAASGDKEQLVPERLCLLQCLHCGKAPVLESQP